MSEDARFEDAGGGALDLHADDAEGLTVLSALVQDAVLSASDMRWDRKARQLVLLLNRFRWEDRVAADRQRRPYERVRSLLIVSDALKVQSQGLQPGNPDLVLSLLSLDWAPGEDGTGQLTVTLAGDGAIRVAAECVNVRLRDVTRPYVAPSGKVPGHPE